MLNITNLEDALYTWAFGVGGIPTIFAHQNAPRPTTEYVLINIIQATPSGIAEHLDTLKVADDSVDIDYSNLENLLVSINVYYSGSFQTATKLKDSLARVTVRDALFAAGLGYERAASVDEIPEEINKQWEERAHFDCFFFTRSLDEENIESIRKIEITNEINDDGDTVTIEHP